MKKLFKCLKYGMKLSPSLVLATLANSFAISSLPFIALYYSGLILDMLLEGAGTSLIMDKVWWMISFSLGLGILKSLSAVMMNIEVFICEKRLSQVISMKSMTISFDKLEDKDVKAMLQRAEEGSNGSGGFPELISYSVSGLVTAILSIVYAIILFSKAFASIDRVSDDALFNFLNNPWSFLVILGLLVIILLASVFIFSYLNKYSYEFFKFNTKSNRESSYIFDMTQDYKYAKDIRIYHMHPLFMRITTNLNNEMEKSYSAFAKKEGQLNVLASLISSVLLFCSYLYIGGKAYYGIISVGSIITIVGAISSFANALMDGLNYISSVIVQVKYLTNFFDYLEIDGTEKNKTAILTPKQGTIEFKHVYFKYPNTDTYALEDVSFVLEPKKKLAIVGRNGAGKSTIIKLIARFYHPLKGEIDLNGANIETLDFDSYQKVLGILFQDFSLFGFPLKDNVACKDEGIDDDKVKKALDLAGYDYSNKNKLPKGIDTYLFNYVEKGTELSGGEQQKVAIARALYKDSPFILLDEPTSALDPLSELAVYNSIEKLVNDRTSLFISHRMSSTKFCQKIIVLDKGKIVQIGDHPSLMKQKEGIYYKMFTEQAKYYI